VKLRKYGHSCLLVEERGETLLFDPGRREFLDDRATLDAFAAVSLVVITHWHADHADPELIGRIVRRSGAKVLAPAEGDGELRAAGVTPTVPADGKLAVGAFELELAGAVHEPILGSAVPRNVACLVNGRLLNTGDSFDAVLDRYRGVEVLALPISAPWLKELDAAVFADRLAPRRVVPVHDGYLKDFFRTRRYDTYRQYLDKKNIGFEGTVSSETSIDL
jgi:L-ascorbate metabolism protein UlaG (beta-lactamase superfamily)